MTTPRIAYCVDESTIGEGWDMFMEDRIEDGETVVKWDGLDRIIQDMLIDQIGNALCNSTIPEVVNDIMHDVTTDYMEGK